MISFVICSINPVLYSRISTHLKELLGDEPYEIIGIHNAQGICEGYNRGLKLSRGEVVIFCHDDIEILTPEFVPRLKKHMSNFDIVGVAGTSRLSGPAWIVSGPPFSSGIMLHPMRQLFQISFYGAFRKAMPDRQAMDGVFLAFRREVIERVGWDDQTFRGFHFYDLDCTYRAYRMGYRLAVVVDLPMVHHSGGKFDKIWQEQAQLFIRKHGATLQTVTKRSYQTSVVEVADKREAVILMKLYSDALPD
jgi:GT2 family glycosyltransferase